MGRFGAWVARLFDAVPPEEMAGAQLEGPYWEVAHRGLDHAEFFRRIPTLVPEGSVLVLEGGWPSPHLRQFLQEHAFAPETRVARGTIWPRGDVVHLPASRQVLEELAKHAEGAAYPEVCTHLHVHAAGRVVVQWYDAFGAPCYVSKALPTERVEAFCGELGTSFKDGSEA
jgi:hypothetical protein